MPPGQAQTSKTALLEASDMALEPTEIREILTEMADGEDFLRVVPEFFCPEVVGHTDVKLGILCCLANQWDSPDGRDRINILLKGQPGCGKTVFIDHLRDHWGALYLSGEAKKSSLQGDGRRNDGGTRLFAKYNGGIVVHDEIEAFSDINTLRDVLEGGRYVETVGGKYEEFEAQIRYVAAANDISKVPTPILSRFDLVYHFDMPSVNESIQIARRIIAGVKNRETTDEMLHIYIGAAMGLNPIVRPKDISDLEAKVQPLADHFTSIDEGRSGRWIRSIIRIAKALARLKLKDEVTGVEIAEAIEMRTTSDNELEIPFD